MFSRNFELSKVYLLCAQYLANGSNLPNFYPRLTSRDRAGPKSAHRSSTLPSDRVACSVFLLTASYQNLGILPLHKPKGPCGSYYEYVNGQTHNRITESGLSDELSRVFQANKRRYGSRRLKVEMQEMGYKVGRHRVRKLLKEQGLKAIQPHSFVPKTTQSKHGLVACQNLLGIGFEVVRPNQAWVSDITYISLKNRKWAYLAAWTDLFTRRIVGWTIDTSMTQELIIVALNNGIKRYKPTSGLILHSDRGGQYFGIKFKQMIDKHHFKQSMAGVKSVYENAHAESIWATIKRELVEKGTFESLEDAKTELFDYIEVYYNRNRRHSALNYQSPEKFEQMYHQNQLLNLQSKVSA